MGGDSDWEGCGSKPPTGVTCEAGAMAMPIFQTRKPRHREVKGLVQGHTATPRQRRDAHRAEGSGAPSPLCPAAPHLPNSPFPSCSSAGLVGPACTGRPGPRFQSGSNVRLLSDSRSLASALSVCDRRAWWCSVCGWRWQNTQDTGVGGQPRPQPPCHCSCCVASGRGLPSLVLGFLRDGSGGLEQRMPAPRLVLVPGARWDW